MRFEIPSSAPAIVDNRSGQDIFKNMQCSKHPDREAKRKCYQCKQPICPECQLKLEGHIFCSENCHQEWLKKEELHKQKSASKKARPRNEVRLAVLEDKMEQSASNWFKLEASLQKLEHGQGRLRTGTLVALVAVVIIILAAAVAAMVGSMNRAFRPAPEKTAQNSSQKSSGFDPGYPASLVDAIYLEPPNLELPPGEMPVERGKINLYGSAPAARRVSLLVNGRENQSFPLKSTSFAFREVPLAPGANIVQVLARDEKGNLAYSIAELVEYSGEEKARVHYTPGLNYQRGPRQMNGIALTFDAGGDAGYAAELLEILRERGIKATIFVTGQFIEQNPDLVRQIVEDGHELGNHTYSHPHLTTFETNMRQWTKPGVTREFVQNELLTTSRLFKETTASSMAHFWRAPYGEQNPEIRRWAEEVGFYHVDWCRDPKNSYDTLDWLTDESNKHYRTPEEIRTLLSGLEAAGPEAANGAIILMHLSTGREKDFPEKVLAPSLDALSAKGLKVLKVSQLFPGLVPRPADKK